MLRCLQSFVRCDVQIRENRVFYSMLIISGIGQNMWFIRNHESMFCITYLPTGSGNGNGNGNSKLRKICECHRILYEFFYYALKVASFYKLEVRYSTVLFHHFHIQSLISKPMLLMFIMSTEAMYILCSVVAEIKTSTVTHRSKTKNTWAKCKQILGNEQKETKWEDNKNREKNTGMLQSRVCLGINGYEQRAIGQSIFHFGDFVHCTKNDLAKSSRSSYGESVVCMNTARYIKKQEPKGNF